MLSTFLKRLPSPVGSDRSDTPGWHAHRTVVARRGAGRPEERHHAAMGHARHAAISSEGSAHEIGLYLWRDLPAEGKGAGLVLPRCNTEGMTLHLAEISAAVAPGAHAVLLLDQAGWHGSLALVVPSNITLLPLPPKCPELNPVENVWQFMRENWLSNRIFKSYDDILDHCCFAWNRLTDQPWRIMSIGLRTWAHRF